MATTGYEPDPIPLGRSADAVAVFRLNGTTYELLPNIRCLGVSVRRGADPGSARYRYAFGSTLADPDDPARLHEVFPLGSVGPRVVRADDQLVVVLVRPGGDWALLHWGFVRAPQGDYAADESGGTEAATFVSVGAAVREWDEPLAGAYVRDSDGPLLVSDTPTDLPMRFEPDGWPNASPKDADAGETNADGEDQTYPTFLGPFAPDNTVQGEKVRHWTLAMAARHVIMRGVTVADGDPVTGAVPIYSAYVKPGDLAYLDDLLTAVVPAGDPDGILDETDDSTFNLVDIRCPDVDLRGMAWPEALWRLLEPHGFGMEFVLSEGERGDDGLPGLPELHLRVYWEDGGRPGVALGLQAVGAELDPGQTNLQTLSLVRDVTDLANRVAVDADPVTVEASFVLAPGFTPLAGDTVIADTFKRGNAEFTGDARDKYRLFLLDESGEGHYDLASSAFTSGTGTDLSPAFLLGKNARYWAIRRRAPHDNLVSVDDNGDPLKATLFVSFNYNGLKPGVWDGTGSWQAVSSGEWRLLDDRVGFYYTGKDPNSWGNLWPVDAGTLAQFAAAKVCLVDVLAPAFVGARPTFMLLCRVDTDTDDDVVAERRAASPTKFDVTRRLDCSGRYKRTVVSKWSYFADVADVTKTDVTVRDDRDDMLALAEAERWHAESGVTSGSAHVPRVTLAYRLGDKVQGLEPRGLSLRTNAGTEAGESPVYPCVIGIDWELGDDRQGTALALSDHRAAPPVRRGRRRRS